jgi:hypothetical protein
VISAKKKITCKQKRPKSNKVKINWIYLSALALLRLLSLIIIISVDQCYHFFVDKDDKSVRIEDYI